MNMGNSQVKESGAYIIERPEVTITNETVKEQLERILEKYKYKFNNIETRKKLYWEIKEILHQSELSELKFNILQDDEKVIIVPLRKIDKYTLLGIFK